MCASYFTYFCFNLITFWKTYIESSCHVYLQHLFCVAVMYLTYVSSAGDKRAVKVNSLKMCVADMVSAVYSLF